MQISISVNAQDLLEDLLRTTESHTFIGVVIMFPFSNVFNVFWRSVNVYIIEEYQYIKSYIDVKISNQSLIDFDLMKYKISPDLSSNFHIKEEKFNLVIGSNSWS